MNRHNFRSVALVSVTLVLCPELGGCARAPSFDVLGSYFPGWIACMIVGGLAAAACRLILNRLNWARSVPYAPLLYLCVAVLVSCLTWLIVFE